jgi:hypothetical protein
VRYRQDICSFFVLDKIPIVLHTRSRLVREGRSHEAFFEWDRMRCLRPASQAGLGRPGVTVPPHYEGEPIGRLRRHRRTAGKPSGSTEPKLRESKEYGTCRCATERSSSPKSRGGTPSGVARLRFADGVLPPLIFEGKLLTPRTRKRREMAEPRSHLAFAAHAAINPTENSGALHERSLAPVGL